MWLHLYMRSFLRNGDLFLDDSTTLGSFHSIIIFIPQPLVVSPCSLAQLLGYFHLIAFYSAFDYQLLDPPSLMKRVVKGRVEQNI